MNFLDSLSVTCFLHISVSCSLADSISRWILWIMWYDGFTETRFLNFDAYFLCLSDIWWLGEDARFNWASNKRRQWMCEVAYTKWNRDTWSRYFRIWNAWQKVVSYLVGEGHTMVCGLCNYSSSMHKMGSAISCREGISSHLLLSTHLCSLLFPLLELKSLKFGTVPIKFQGITKYLEMLRGYSKKMVTVRSVLHKGLKFEISS